MTGRTLPRLGELERCVLAQLWSHGPAEVKAMHRQIAGAPSDAAG